MIVAVEAVTTGLVLALLMNVAAPTVAGLTVDVVVGVCAVMVADLMVAAVPKVDIVVEWVLWWWRYIGWGLLIVVEGIVCK